MNPEGIKTLGQLKKSGYTARSVREELRSNLIDKLKSGDPIFQGIKGYEATVIPAVERAILAGHSILFLGLRGQAKTRMARLMTDLLDEFVPVVDGAELNDDPLDPISDQARAIIAEHGDATPVRWMSRTERYSEKLATPDVSISDLIGDVDPIKAANLRLSYADQGAIHYGMIPRAHRGIFVINELPDLQARIQVSLFNILQEGDIQIRGFKLLLPLDIQFVFTANPEDYTNRGSIITPLKDRIQSQIFTHYPKDVATGMAITKQEIDLSEDQAERIIMPALIERLVEQIAIEARVSEFVDEKSGVSARLTITAYENIIAAVERRMALNGEERGTARISDLQAAIPAIVGKIEIVYEGEQEGAVNVANRLIASAIRTVASEYFRGVEEKTEFKEGSVSGPIQQVVEWFEGNHVDMLSDASEKQYERALKNVEGLNEAIRHADEAKDGSPDLTRMEFLLHVLAGFSILDKKNIGPDIRFADYFSSVMPGEEDYLA